MARLKAAALLVVLVAVAGAALLLLFHRQAQERERLAQERQLKNELTVRTLETFSDLVFARLTTTTMLQAALQRKAPAEELAQLKRAHDAAYADAGTRMPRVLVGAQRLLDPESHAELEGLVQVHRRPLELLSRCVTDAYDAQAGVKPARQFDCDVETLLNVSRDCSEALASALGKEFALGLPLAPNQAARVAVAAAEVRRRCDVAATGVA
jgi:hypothetical protein